MPRHRFAAFAFATAGTLIPIVARAHFVLQAPPNWADQDSQGMPEKSAPCGQADPGAPAAPTGIVKSFAPGDTVTITINETTPHPGHYRVVLSATGQSGLPADPPVTVVSGDPCGSTIIQDPPVFPVLADGMLTHTAAFTAPQTFTVKLPTDVTCTNCTLQVAEFMSQHGLNNPGGCFYHHCADISIGTADAGPVAGGSSDSGCGCALGDARDSLAAVFLMVAVVVVARRRTSAPGASRRARNRRAHRGEAAIPEVAVLGTCPCAGRQVSVRA